MSNEKKLEHLMAMLRQEEREQRERQYAGRRETLERAIRHRLTLDLLGALEPLHYQVMPVRSTAPIATFVYHGWHYYLAYTLRRGLVLGAMASVDVFPNKTQEVRDNETFLKALMALDEQLEASDLAHA